MKKISTLVLIVVSIIGTLNAKVTLPSILSNNMVLQRNSEVNLYGMAKANSKVTITPSWSKEKFTLKSDGDGRWATTVPTIEAGGPYTITFDDGEKTILDNILLGEVWVCSGQSNMEMPVGGYIYQPTEGAMDAVMEANSYPDIRMFTVPRCISETPTADCDTTWQLSTPMTVRTFSAVAYFFGKELNKMLNVPIGIITANWGGTVIEAWMSRETLDAIDGRNADLEKNRKGANASTVLYNGMILPISRFTAKGFLWYQGESNRHNWYDYAKLQRAQIESWRKLWGDENMPFYITQIAPYCYEGSTLRGTPLFVDQQYKAVENLLHSGIACTTDIGDYSLIHPAKKKEVAQRLALMALSNDYGVEGLPSQSPRFKSMERKENKLIISFMGLTSSGNFNISDPDATNCFDGRQEAKGFEVAGEDRKFYPAKANHRWYSNTIEVWCDSVPNPAAVRYAYQNYSSEPNIRTQFGLPLPSFRSDDWEMEDIGIK